MNRASITVLPVTSMLASGMPSFISAALADCVGAKWRVTIGEASRRLTSSGKGDQMSPVRSPAST